MLSLSFPLCPIIILSYVSSVSLSASINKAGCNAQGEYTKNILTLYILYKDIHIRTCYYELIYPHYSLQISSFSLLLDPLFFPLHLF